MSLLMLPASLPMDVTAAVLDRFTAPRVVSEPRAGGAHPFSAGYAYDLNGNRLARTVEASGTTETTSYSYDDNDRLLAETTDGAATQYAYDGNGSLASKVKAGEFAYSFSYNLQGRLAAAQVSRIEGGRNVSLSAEYAYNPNGIRTSALQAVDGIVSDRHFLLDDDLTGYDQVLEESATIGGAPIKSYVIGDDVLAQDGFAFLQDGHGSTRALAGDNGSVAESYDYDAYGRMLGGNPGVAEERSLTDILYAGEQFDPGLQMEYLRARYYDQDNGRFNRLDPFDGSYDEPQSLHKYAYAHCDPVNGVDPTGEFSLSEFYTVASAIANMASLVINVRGFFKNSATAKIYSLQALSFLIAGDAWSATGYILIAAYYETLTVANAVGSILSIIGLGQAFNAIGQTLTAALGQFFGAFDGGYLALANGGTMAGAFVMDAAIADVGISTIASTILTTIISGAENLGVFCQGKPNEAQKIVQKGRGPRGIKRIDGPKVTGEQWHAHSSDGKGAVNLDGSSKHGNNNWINSEIKKFLRQFGWNL